MTRGRLLLIAVCMSCGPHIPAHAEVKNGGARGEMLYATHCRDCHTAEADWRGKKRASDWSSLKAQVRRWQYNVGMGWDEKDINSVAQYLNSHIYRFPAHTADTVAHASGGVGQEDRDSMQGVMKHYNLKLVFAEQNSGAYLSEVKVVIERVKGGKILEAESEGPWFFARLPPGSYRITAESRDRRVTRSIAISGEKRVELTLYWP